MDKMQVRDTPSHAYGFLFGRCFHILGAIWLPIAIYAVGSIAYAPRFFASAERIAQFGTAAELWREAIEMLALVVPATAVFSMLAVSLCGLALGIEKDRFLLHFTFGARESRLFLAALRLMLLLAGVVVALGVVAYLAAWALAGLGVAAIPVDANGMPVSAEFPSSAVLGVGLIALAAVLYAAIRFGFLLAPFAAADEPVTLRRAWRLSAGQFWPMLIATFGIVVPVGAVVVIASFFVLGADFGRFYGFAADSRAQHFSDMAAIIAARAPALTGLNAVGVFLFSSLLCSAFASAYFSGPASREEKSEAVEDMSPMMPMMGPMMAPVVIAAANEPVIEHSPPGQTGIEIHDSKESEGILPPRDMHIATVSKARSNGHARDAAEADDILDLKSFDEIQPASGREQVHRAIAAAASRGDANGHDAGHLTYSPGGADDGLWPAYGARPVERGIFRSVAGFIAAAAAMARSRKRGIA